MPPTPRQTVPRPGRGGIVSLPWQPIFQTAINQPKIPEIYARPGSFVAIIRGNKEDSLKLERGATFKTSLWKRNLRDQRHSCFCEFLTAVKPTNLLLLNTPSNPQWPSFVVEERERERDFTRESILIRGRACWKAIPRVLFIHSFNVWIVFARVGLPCSRIERQFKASEKEREIIQNFNHRWFWFLVN